MGICTFGSRSSYDSPKTIEVEKIVERIVKMPNPDPRKWEVNNFLEDSRGDYLLVDITYPDCTNYEGRKIMLYEGVTMKQLRAQKLIDPHFSENKKYHSPIARFEPTEEGWKMGRALIDSLV